MTVPTKWDQRFLDLAHVVKTWSKDPSTQVGAVIANDKVLVSQGFNGFPKGFPDSPELLNDREKKYEITIHAELNAILHAERNLLDCTIYTTTFPCARCASVIVQSGIGWVVTHEPSDELVTRWGSSFELARMILEEGGVEWIYLPTKGN